MKTTTISIYKSLTLKGLPEGGRQKEFGLILLKCQISAKSPFLIISKYNFHLRHVDIKAKKFMPLKTFPISIIKKLPCYIQTPYCIKKTLLHTSYWACKSDSCSTLYRLQQNYSAVFHKSTHCMLLKPSS